MIGCISDFDVDEMRRKIDSALDRFTNLGSGWSIMKILKFVLSIVRYNPLTGSSFILTPIDLGNRHAIVNIQNFNDNMCFKWSILASLFPAVRDAERVSKYKPHESKVDFSSLKYPVTLAQIRQFERLNTEFTINVYTYVKCEVRPVYVSHHDKRNKHINLMMLIDGENTHYTLINSMSRLCANRTLHKSFTWHCCHCCHPFSSEKAFNNHIDDCSRHIRQQVRFPTDDIVKFKSFKHCSRLDFILYADFESVLKPTNTTPTNDVTYSINTHEVSGYCLYAVSKHDMYSSVPLYYSGVNAMRRFFNDLLSEQQRISLIFGLNIEMLPLTDDQWTQFNDATVCPYCGVPFTDVTKRILHHNHTTGKFESAACSRCNLQLKPNKRKSYKDDSDFFIPVVMHNLKNYDSHFIIKEFDHSFVRRGDNKYNDVRIIANNMEKFISFDINYMRFIDSVQFVSASLDTFVKNLKQAGVEKFIHTKKHWGDKLSIIDKGVMPYEWFDCLDKLQANCLPPIESFYSKLNDEGITEADYLRAQNVWSEFSCKTFKEYHDIYMITDVLLLADVFEEFRTMCLNNYQRSLGMGC